MTDFTKLGLSPTLLTAVEALGFETPTPIQSEAIPLVLRGRDIVGLAQTGTGKTAAFGLPLVQQLLDQKTPARPKNVRALILAPTRELVNQIAANLKDYSRRTPLRINCVVGGASINVQMKHLGRGTDILVATPGRLLDLVKRRAVFLDTAKFLVLDEADQMLDLGFIHALREISKLVGTPRQTLLFSATMPKQIADLSRTYLTDPVRIEVSPAGRTADKVDQLVHFVTQRGKVELLKKLLAERPDDLSLVFSRTKHGAEKLMKTLAANGFAAGSIHGNKSQGQRERAIASFKKGEIRVLVATDVAARGIDITGVSHVYNYDLPEVPESYVHRIGRTARAGAGGQAVAFCTPADMHLLRDIERLTGLTLTVAGGEFSDEDIAEARKAPKGRGGRGGGQRSGQRAGQPSGRPANKQRPKHGAGANSNNRPPKWRRNKRKPAAA